MVEVLLVLLFLGIYFVIPYFGAVWMMKRMRKRWKKLGSDSFGWRLANGLLFLGCALITFAVVTTLLWIVKVIF